MVLYLIRGLIDIIRGSGVSETMIGVVCSVLEARHYIGRGTGGVWERWEVGSDVVAWAVFDELSLVETEASRPELQASKPLSPEMR